MTVFHNRASMCCPRSSEGQGGLNVVLWIGRRGQRFVQPLHHSGLGKQTPNEAYTALLPAVKLAA